jgi:hypothetical protein
MPFSDTERGWGEVHRTHVNFRFLLQSINPKTRRGRVSPPSIILIGLYKSNSQKLVKMNTRLTYDTKVKACPRT